MPIDKKELEFLMRTAEETRRMEKMLGIPKMMEKFKANEQLFKNALETTQFLKQLTSLGVRGISGEDFRNSIAIQTGAGADSIKQFLESTKASGAYEAVRSFQEQELKYASIFSLPGVTGVKGIAEAMNSVFKSPIYSSFLPNDAALSAVVASINSPWVNVKNSAYSVESLASLQTIGRILQQSPPYAELGSGALRELLGDWRHLSIPKGIDLDWKSRVGFYVEAGFDNRLTRLPGAAFRESLNVTEIVSEDSEITEAPAEDEEEINPTAEPVIRRMGSSFQLLYKLERNLREFLLERMSGCFGPQWHIQRVPRDVLARWRKKCEEDSNKSELLEYADFPDYVKILERTDNWNEVFGHIFGNKEDVCLSLSRLNLIRRATMHARPITKEDHLLLIVEARRIFKAIAKKK